MIYVSRRLLITCLLLVSACVVAGIWGLRSGAVTLDTSQVFAALMGDAPRSMTMVVTEWRLPRVLMALLIGAALGVSGAIFQSLMRNPLGSPDVMGFNTGAWSGVLVAMVLFGQDLRLSRWQQWWAALSLRCWSGCSPGVTASTPFG